MQQKDKNPLVSIIMPSYNSSLYIEDSLRSIIDQTLTDWELLITDDFSTDDTCKIVEDYTYFEKRIKLFRLDKNTGAGNARNNSIINARGRFIAFCDSDDYWTPDKLEKQISFMINNKTALSYSNYFVIDENNQIIGERILPSKVDYNSMLLNNYIGCLTAVYDSSIVKKMYMHNLKNRQDWLLWLDILKKVDYALNVNEKIAYYRRRNDSISSNKIKMMKYNWLIYHKYERFSLLKSVFYITRYALMYIKK